MVLSHSRKEVVVWSERMDQLAWHHAHNEAFRRLGGIPAVVGIDDLKTGIAEGARPWGRVNPAYRSYARCVGFHVDACLPGCPEDKGKVENKVGAVRRRLRLAGPYAGLAALQGDSDEQLARWDERRTCPATGRTVHNSWLEEQKALRPLPLLPEVFDVAVTRVVQKDCTVNFEGRAYSVPFRLCGLDVEVRVAPRRSRSSTRGGWWPSTPAPAGSGSSSTRPTTRAPGTTGSRRRCRWAGWAGSSRRSSGSRWSSGRSTSMPRWRRWPDEHRHQGEQAPALEVDGTRERLARLGLAHAAEALAEELSEAVKHDRPAHAVLDRLLAWSCPSGTSGGCRPRCGFGLPPGMTLATSTSPSSRRSSGGRSRRWRPAPSSAST